MKQSLHTGFTLVELVTTIILIAILAVTVLPRLFTTSNYSAFTLRDEFIAELRKVQLMAMNNQDRCYRINVDDSQYQTLVLQSDCATSVRNRDPQPLHNGASLKLSGATNFALQFTTSGTITACAGGCSIDVVADDSLTLTIESQGYIHGR
ncbi:type II secretion system protein [Shewanella waksmanii]|uniref:type II secretion system protein n=1 Tax=Shewanella waksmanii TaxID=213783 RepID=UPI0004B2F6B0|nr:type II secretion system protein [Shewanella waksmanii]